VSGKEKDYIKLFDVINKQESYNEDDLKILFNGKNLSAIKRYLKEKILESLRLYYAKQHKQKELGVMIDNMAILELKGLYSLLRKEIEKAKKILKELRVDYEYLSVFNFERKLLTQQGYTDIEEKNINELCDTTLVASDRLANLMKYLVVEMLQNYINANPTANREKLDQLMQKDFMQNENLALSFYAKNLFYNLNAMYAAKQQKFHSAKFYFEEAVLFWQANPDKIRFHFTSFVNVYTNYLISVFDLEEFDQALLKIENFKRYIRKYTPDAYKGAAQQFDLQLHIFVLELEYYVRSKAYNLIVAIANDITSFVETNEDAIKVTRKNYFNYHVAHACFNQKKYHRALDFIMPIINDKNRLTADANYTAPTVFVYLFCHYELGNEQLVKNQIRKFKTLLKQYEIFNNYEITIMQLLVKLVDKRYKNKLYDIFVEANKENENNKKNITDISAAFDFDAWLIDKINTVENK